MPPPYECRLGTAQGPRINPPWQPNQPQTERSKVEALRLAESEGVNFPEDVLLTDADANLPLGAYAAYHAGGTTAASASMSSESWIWEDFCTRHGNLKIQVRPSILTSDESIIGVLAHESHELNEIFNHIQTHGHILANQLHRQIAPNINGNWHCQAWDRSDDLIRARRNRIGANT